MRTTDALRDVRAAVGPRRTMVAALLGAAGSAALGAGSTESKRKKKKKKSPQPCPVDSTCPSGSVKLLNGTCAVSCSGDQDFQGGCSCSYVSAENTHVKVANTTCEFLQQECTSTSQCPRGTHCQQTGCGGAYRCNAVCAP